MLFGLMQVLIGPMVRRGVFIGRWTDRAWMGLKQSVKVVKDGRWQKGGRSTEKVSRHLDRMIVSMRADIPLGARALHPVHCQQHE